ncbi:MAG TPA: hypothetical protein VG367_10075 [Mucilaginibacter sp.]|jgi:phosphoglycerol transferase MdoB-like AlkP superfamily enzyme|nr:hypothetical protein [Mucilaginibacter sp.]
MLKHARNHPIGIDAHTPPAEMPYINYMPRSSKISYIHLYLYSKNLATLMQPDEIAFLAGLMIVPLLFLFFWRFLLNPQRAILLFAIACALGAAALTHLKNPLPGKPNFYMFLFCPLYQLLLLRGMLYIFRSALHRDPVNAPRKSFFSEDDGLGSDRLFKVAFLILSLVVPVGIFACFYS